MLAPAAATTQQNKKYQDIDDFPGLLEERFAHFEPSFSDVITGKKGV